MPDFMPISMQDFMYSSKSELRKEITIYLFLSERRLRFSLFNCCGDLLVQHLTVAAIYLLSTLTDAPVYLFSTLTTAAIYVLLSNC